MFGECCSERQERRHDPALLRAQHTPGARGGATVHRFHAQPKRLHVADEGAGRLTQTTAGAQQQEFRPGIEVEQIAQRCKSQRRDIRGIVPRQSAQRRQEQPCRENIVPYPKPPPGEAGDDRSLPRLVAAQFNPCSLAVQGLAPSSRGPMRSACAASPLLLLALRSASCGERPSVISSDEDT